MSKGIRQLLETKIIVFRERVEQEEPISKANLLRLLRIIELEAKSMVIMMGILGNYSPEASLAGATETDPLFDELESLAGELDIGLDKN